MMKKRLLIFLISFLSFSALAEQTVTTENAWLREAPPTVKVWAAYMTLKNPTDQDMVLIDADSPAFENLMFHKTEIIDGIAKMHHADHIVIPAHSSFEFKPGEYHIMLMGRKIPLKEGDEVKLTLIFKNLERQEITAVVKKSSNENMQ